MSFLKRLAGSRAFIAAVIFFIGSVITAALILYPRPFQPEPTAAPGSSETARTFPAVSADTVVLTTDPSPAGGSLSDADLFLAKVAFDYTGAQIRPDLDGLLSVTLSGAELTKGVDFVVSYSENVGAGRLGARVDVSGIGRFEGGTSVRFSILPSRVAASVVSSEDGDLLLSWDEVTGAEGYRLVCSLDESFDEGRLYYEETKETSFDFSQRLEAGEKLFVKVCAFMTALDPAFADDPITSRVYGDLGPALEISFKKAVSSLRLSDTSFVYSGSSIYPTVSVYSASGEKLVSGVDYALEYINNTVPGVASAVVKGLGDYSGELSADFVIRPSKNVLRLAGVSGSKISVSWNADPYCDGYIILYSKDPGFSKWDYFTTYDPSRTSATIDTGSSDEIRWYLKISAFVVTNRERGSWKGVYSDVISADVNSSEPYIPPAASSVSPTAPPASTSPAFDDPVVPDQVYTDLTSLKKILTEQIKDHDGNWSVYVKNLRTDEELIINNRKYFPASLMKLFIMAAAYKAIEDGVTTEDAVIANLTEMITVSSNSASNLLLGQIGYTAPRDWIESNGYKDTFYCRGFLSGANYDSTVISPGDNYSTVADIGRLMVSIYDGTCVSKDASERMMSLLKKQKRVSKIPAGVPDGVVTANKTGEVSGNTHDCAIVYLDGNPYVLCVMTEIPGAAESWDPEVTIISKTVFDYMKNLA